MRTPLYFQNSARFHIYQLWSLKLSQCSGDTVRRHPLRCGEAETCGGFLSFFSFLAKQLDLWPVTGYPASVPRKGA